MSIPIKYCFLVKAADDPASFAKLHPTMKRNIEGGHFSIYSCDHEPRCRELTDEEASDLMNRFRQPIAKGQ